uniref:DUF4416 family protein n=1 Tax=candidate division WOR-3 bacterium TaxID=2052148 RepID=A0A7C4U884_UNCW3
MRCIVFFGLIYSDEKNLREAKLWIEEGGRIIEETEPIPFNFTDYYEEEMGGNLKRCWVGIEKIIFENELVHLKLKSIEFEKKLSIEGKRTVNIDPGGISHSRVVLVTTKNYSHRIYLGEGIYGEVTLIYKNKNFQELHWTYPDYRTDIFKNFAKRMRNYLFV